MFPLFTDALPENARELERLLNASLQRLFRGIDEAAAVADDKYPQLAEIRITLDGAQLRSDAPPPSLRSTASGPALQVARFQISGERISAGPATVNLRLDAHGVALDQGRDPSGNVVLLVKTADDGEIEVSADTAAIEQAISAVAKSEASKHGVVVDQVQLSIKSRGQRSLDAEVQLRAKKLFFSTIVRVSAKLDVDDQLNAQLSGLSCNGDGAIGALACGALQPHLQKLDGRSFSLMALPLGEVRLRDVRIATGDQIRITAEFGC
ncbi:MAG: hypothetical protein M3032_08135 [Verrucomicrobiota bacterium]|nr:hypothetical protein [Verrucomicrobiota bacterium]